MRSMTSLISIGVLLAAMQAHAEVVLTAAALSKNGCSVDCVNPSAPALPMASPMSQVELDTFRGGETPARATQVLTATTTGNLLNGNVIGGSVNLADNTFANFGGIGNIAINTGAQVSLQSAMNLTINIAP